MKDARPVGQIGESAPAVVGLDLSLTSTGVATADDGLYRLETNRMRGHDRLAWLCDEIDLLIDYDADLIVVEGPSFGSKGDAVHQLGGLWWMVTQQLWRNKIPYAVVPPPVLKRYATGKGNAGKDQVLAAAIRRYPGFEISGNDIADALILRAMGLDHLGHPLAVMPATHWAAMAKVDWPDKERRHDS